MGSKNGSFNIYVIGSELEKCYKKLLCICNMYD